MRYWLVMPAAGSSQRFGGGRRKQFAPLAGTTVVDLALQPFLRDARCLGAILVLAADDAGGANDAGGASGAGADGSGGVGVGSGTTATPLLRVAGGARRCDSVLRGLEALAARAAAEDWVLVHDAARPCLSSADLEQLLAAGEGHAVGALLAARVSDTVKQAAEAAPAAPAAHSGCTVDRERLWRALTPQMFRYGALCAALRAAIASGRAPTDEAQAFEWQGMRPLLVPAQYSNIKITTAEDLVIAEALLAARRAAAAMGEA